MSTDRIVTAEQAFAAGVADEAADPAPALTRDEIERVAARARQHNTDAASRKESDAA
jgi:hypothetical protein